MDEYTIEGVTDWELDDDTILTDGDELNVYTWVEENELLIVAVFESTNDPLGFILIDPEGLLEAKSESELHAE